MADHFLTKSLIDLDQCLRHDDQLVLEFYSEIHALLQERAGPLTARIFAEPLISRGNDTASPSVSWYSDIDGSGQPISRLSEDAQAAMQTKLASHLEPLRPLLDDPVDGPLLTAALNVVNPSNVWAIGGQPIIINWGMLPAGLNHEGPARDAHYEKTLGRYLPLSVDPILQSTATTTAAATLGAATAAVAAPHAARAAASPKTDEQQNMAEETQTQAHSRALAPPPRRVPVSAWLPLLLLLVLCGGALIWLLIPGSRIFPNLAQDRAITNQAAIEAAEGVNRALEERLQVLKSSLSGAVCEDDGTLKMPDGRTIEGLLPPDPTDPNDLPGAVQDASPRSVLPPDPDRVQVPEAANPNDTTTLITHIEERTAIVLVPTNKGLSSGTGFFVGPDLLVTNYHVIANPGPQGIFVTNKALGQVHNANVIKSLGPLDATGGDFALLQIPGVAQPAFSIFQSTDSLKLMSVIAAGYPGDILSSDDQFQQLRKGNMQAVPELAVTDGTVSTEQNLNPTTRVLVHSAPISTGNSGGPLIDMCGRLIGVNTFVKRGALRTLNFALSPKDLVAFLANTNALPTVVTDRCTPQIQRPQAPQSAAIQPDPEIKKLPIPQLKVE